MASASPGEFRERYHQALTTYISGSAEEAELVDAMGLGRAALDEGRGLVDLLSIHQSVLPAVIAELPRATVSGQIAVIAKAEEFLTQVAAPFEMTHLGWREAVDQLRRLNQSLERQVAERTVALRASERRFQDIAEVSGDWMWETDREHRFTVVFGEREGALSIRGDPLVGRTRWEGADANPATDELWARHKADLDAHRPFRHFRYENHSPDGVRLFVAASGKPVFDHDGSFLGYRGTATDETAMVEARRRAEEAEVTTGRIFETSQDLILVTDRQGRFTRVSPSAMSILGYNPDEMVGRSGAEFLYSEDLDNTRNEMRLARRGGKTQNFECRYVHKQGRIVSLWWTGVWSASAHQYFFIGRDVTNRKAAEEALRESEQAARGVIESSLDAVVQMDEAGIITEWNSQAEAVFGWSRGEAVGRLLSSLIIPPAHRERHEAGLARFLATGRSAVLGKRLFLDASCSDGREIEVEVAITALRRESGYLFNGFIRDLTQQIAIAGQLQQAQKMEAIGNLTGGMAHDFNNLLGIIIGNLDLLRDRQSGDPDAEELSREALDAALRGADLTRRLLAFARRQPLQSAKTDVNELVGGIVKLLERTLGEQIQITLDLNPDTWPVVVDPAQLESALTNLANNARDAMPKGGQLIIVTENRSLDADYASLHAELHPGDYAMIEVSDTGTGMPREVADHIFEPFYTTKEQGKGTGLGLSMVFGFMKQSGGHINVYSEAGIGTTFRLFLPRSGAGAEADASVLPAAPVRGGGETVLAVEDNASLRRVVARQLTELDYHILEAEDAQTALRVLESERVDLMLTDVVMPGGTSGYELARTVLSRWPEIKIVLTSGFPETRINSDGDTLNLPLLSKPYRRDDLGRIIREVLDS